MHRKPEMGYNKTPPDAQWAERKELPVTAARCTLNKENTNEGMVQDSFTDILLFLEISQGWIIGGGSGILQTGTVWSCSLSQHSVILRGRSLLKTPWKLRPKGQAILTTQQIYWNISLRINILFQMHSIHHRNNCAGDCVACYFSTLGQKEKD